MGETKKVETNSKSLKRGKVGDSKNWEPKRGKKNMRCLAGNPLCKKGQ